MKKFNHETVIINKECWKFMWNLERTTHGFKPLNDDLLNKIWSKIVSRNNGANPATHPIADNEIRVDKDSFNIGWESVKANITNNGFSYRQDGFIATGMYM